MDKEDILVIPCDSLSPNSMILALAGEEVGRFWFEDGQLMFKGNPDKSAEIFLESLMKMANEHN